MCVLFVLFLSSVHYCERCCGSFCFSDVCVGVSIVRVFLCRSRLLFCLCFLCVCCSVSVLVVFVCRCCVWCLCCILCVCLMVFVVVLCCVVFSFFWLFGVLRVLVDVVFCLGRMWSLCVVCVVFCVFVGVCHVLCGVCLCSVSVVVCVCGVCVCLLLFIVLVVGCVCVFSVAC